MTDLTLDRICGAAAILLAGLSGTGPWILMWYWSL
jgi:hypothetical protein